MTVTKKGQRGGRREGAGRKGINDGQERRKASIHCSRTEEGLCHGLLSLLREGVPLERIDGRRIQWAAEQYHAERTERLERKNERAKKNIDALQRELKAIESD